MKRLIICGTNYQVILAVQLKLTLFKDDMIDVWILDTMNNAKILAANATKLNLFQSVISIETTNLLIEKSMISNLTSAIKLGLGLTKLKVDNYNEIITYNFDVSYYNLINALEKQSMTPKWSKLEEGLFSYNTDFYICGKRYKIIEKIRQLRRKNKVMTLFSSFYAMFPKYKKIYPGWNNITIPSFCTEIKMLKNAMEIIFDYRPENIKERYIFFASASDIDNHPFGETDIILKVADLVGKDNLLVKMHPRDTRKIYEQQGIHIMKQSSTPWESIQIVNNFKNKKLLTVTSGAFISISASMEDETDCFLLYPEVKQMDENYTDYVARIDSTISELHADGKCGSIHKMNLEEFKKTLL